MNKDLKVVLGIVAGMIVGKMMFNVIEDMGLRMLLESGSNGDFAISEKLHMLLFSSGAVKIWGGGIVGGIVSFLAFVKNKG